MPPFGIASGHQPPRRPLVRTPERSVARLPRGRRGFTVVELVVVLLIIGIVAAVAAPKFYRSLQYHQVESAARRVKVDLEQLQHMARVKSRDQSITFDDAEYTLSGDVIDLDRGGEAYAVDLGDAPFELANVAIDFGGATTITFDGYGNPSAGGTIVLTQGDEQRTIALDAITGQVSITNE